jgi:YaiO family outer membrane protein
MNFKNIHFKYRFVTLAAVMIFMGHSKSVAQTVNADSLFFQAREVAFQDKDYVEAAAMLRQLLRQSPNFTDASVLLGRVLFWAGEPVEAEQLLRSIITKEPERADAWAALISGLLGLRRYDESLSLSRQALALHPEDVEILRQHAFSSAETGDFKEAVTLLDALLQQSPNDQQALWLRREFLRRSRQHRVSAGYARDFFQNSDWDTPDRVSYDIGYEGFYRKATIGLSISFMEWLTLEDEQITLDAYPIINENMYGFLTLSKSTEGLLYPDYKAGASWFFTGFRELELELGLRYYWLPEQNASLYTSSVTYYNQRYYGRIQLFAQNRGNESETSFQGTFRYYFDTTDPDYFVAVRLGQGIRGDEPNDAFDIVRATSVNVGVELNYRIGSNFYLKPSVAVFRTTGTIINTGYLTLAMGASVRF